MGEIKHGTSSAYSYWKCRCEVCIEAKRQRDSDYYARNAEAVKAKRLAAYHADPSKQATASRRYRAQNKDAIAARQRRYYEANAEAIKAKVKAWREANPDRAAENQRRWVQENPERKRELNLASYHKRMAEDPEKTRARRRAWAKTQKGVLANRAARHARRGAPYTKEALDWIASLVDPLCGYCGEPATEIDHILPVSQGGTGELVNLTTACRTCNARKNDLGVEEFLHRLKEGK